MDVKRLTEILYSSEKVQGVFYKNHPIWIEEFTSSNSMVQIKLLDSDENIIVSIKDINEEE